MNKTLKYLLRISLLLDNWLYTVQSRLAIRVYGYHPKHDYLRYADWFKDHITPDDIVADIGSNTGKMANDIADKARFVFGVEIEKELSDIAVKTYSRSNLLFVNEDGTKFDFESRKITVVTLSNVLEHIDERVSFMSDLVKSLGAGSKILIRVPMIDRDWRVFLKKDLGVDYRLDPTHFTEFTQFQFEDELERAGIFIEKLNIKFGEIYAVCAAK